MDEPALTPLDPTFAPKPAASRRRAPPRTNVAPEQPDVVEVTCAPRRLRPWGVALAAVIVLAFAVFAVVSFTGTPVRPWNAVFLTNGQVYFGHIADETPQALVLRDVYYLQASPSLQQRAEGQPAPRPDITLVKLGNELHGPTDAMEINRDHILFTEELRDNSTIVQAIAAAQERAAAPAQPAIPTAPPAAAQAVEAPPAPPAEGASAPATE